MPSIQKPPRDNNDSRTHTAEPRRAQRATENISALFVALRCIPSLMIPPIEQPRKEDRVSRTGASLLEIRNLKLEFGTPQKPLRAVDDVSFTIGAGETVCLVGESGCGKSVTALSIARLVPAPPARYAGGEILLNGRDVLKMSKTALC